MNAELVILSGDENRKIISLLPYMTAEEKIAVVSAYPELLGSGVAAAVTGIAVVTSGIISAVAAKRSAEREAKAAADTLAKQNAMVDKEVTVQQALINAQERRNKIILFSALGAGVIITAVILKKKSSRSKNRK
jgi:hypothetical protein